MKRLTFCLALLAMLIAGTVGAYRIIEVPVAVARTTVVIAGGGVAAGSDCPTGTYMFAWNGDYPSVTYKGCFTSGTAQKDGTVSGDTASISDSYFEAQAANDYVSWAVDTEDGLSGSQGTLFFSLYIVDEGNSDVDNNMAFESYITSNNYLYGFVDDTANAIKFQHRGSGGTAQSVVTANNSIVLATWYRVGYSWSVSEGKHAVKIQSGESKMANWTDAVEETETLTAFNATITEIVFGEKNSGGVIDDTIRIKDIIITSGYKDADQLP